MAEQPTALLVNIHHDIRPRVDECLRTAFAVSSEDLFVASSYARPYIHPIMRPSGKNPRFDLIVLDIFDWIGEAGDRQVVKMNVLPEWFVDDLLSHLNHVLVVVIAPAAAASAVKSHCRLRLKKWPFELIERERLAEQHDVVVDAWTRFCAKPTRQLSKILESYLNPSEE